MEHACTIQTIMEHIVSVKIQVLACLALPPNAGQQGPAAARRAAVLLAAASSTTANSSKLGQQPAAGAHCVQQGGVEGGGPG